GRPAVPSLVSPSLPGPLLLRPSRGPRRAHVPGARGRSANPSGPRPAHRDAQPRRELEHGCIASGLGGPRVPIPGSVLSAWFGGGWTPKPMDYDDGPHRPEENGRGLRRRDEGRVMPRAALESRFPEALESARTLLRQPSVSATGEGVAECAEMVREMMAGIGCKTRTWKNRGYPLVIGELDVGAPVTLIEYEMYDVQPVGDLDAWKVPPFAADIREVPGIGKAIVARGSTNSKGALANHLFTWRMIQD